MDPKMRDIIGYVFPDYRYIRFEWSNLRETFLFEQYKWLIDDLKPKTTAIDFGAGMGDSAIYMIRGHNVSNVVGYELNRAHYNIAMKNVKELGYSSRIKLYNEGAKWDKFTSNTIVKCDIEGAEHELFNQNLDLSKVYRICIEYHHDVQDLPKILANNGFKVKIKVGAPTLLLGQCGMIYAWRK